MATTEAQNSSGADAEPPQNEERTATVAEVANCKELYAAVKATSSIIDEAKLRLSSRGIRYQAVDPADAAIAIIEIPSTSCTGYSCGEELVVGVDLEVLEDALKGNAGPVKLLINSDSILVDPSTGLSKEVPTIDSTAIRKEPEIPDLTDRVSLQVPGHKLHRVIQAAQEDFMEFRVNRDRFEIECGSGRVGEDFRLGTEATPIGDCGDKLELRTLLSVDYLEDVIGHSLNKFAPMVEITMGTDVPVDFHRTTASGLEYTAMLAPRIEGK